MIKERLLIGLATIALLAACGGGGGGGGGGSVPGASALASPTPAAAPTLAAGQGLVRFTITIPAVTGTTSSRRAQFVAPGTESMTLTLLQNNNSTTGSGIGVVQGPFNVTSGSRGCSTSGAVTCSFSIAAPAGNDIFLATTFSLPNAQNQLGSGAVSLNVVQNANNTANLTLSGPIASIAAVSNNGANSDTLWDGIGTFLPITADELGLLQQPGSHARKARITPASGAPAAILSERLFLIGQDAAGNVILNPTTYDQPIVLTLTLNGGPANVTVTDTPPAGLTCGGNTTTSSDNGTVNVCSPSDVVTLSLIGTIASPLISVGDFGTYGINFPTVTASLNAPPGGFSPVVFPFTVEVTGGNSLPVIVQ